MKLLAHKCPKSELSGKLKLVTTLFISVKQIFWREIMPAQFFLGFYCLPFTNTYIYHSRNQLPKKSKEMQSKISAFFKPSPSPLRETPEPSPFSRDSIGSASEELKEEPEITVTYKRINSKKGR